MKLLVTCPPMLGLIDEFVPLAREQGFELVPAKVTQTLSEEELMSLLPHYEGWIIGDDPATRRVFEAGKAGRLKAAVKWGIGVDNVDFKACKDLGIPVINTPQMFGGEVADVALAYVIGLARELFTIDRGVRAGAWPKPPGISLAGKKVGLVGFGDIGRAAARRLLACEMEVVAYDPGIEGDGGLAGVQRAAWPERVEEVDFLVFTCSLNDRNRHMLNAEVLARCKRGVFVVNVARGPLIDEPALTAALQSGQVRAAALDVFEIEPLPADSPLRAMPQCVFGSHNGSNTKDAVRRASHEAMKRLFGFLRS
jgi:D-3-phosphoglycerate dehydrogenase / 2-oxoglutarate reductase